MKYTSKKIQEILTSPSAVQGLEYIQPIYEEATTALWLMQSIGLQMDDAKWIADEIAKQMFPQSATWGLDYWEELYAIPTNENISVENRRRIILSKKLTRAPANPKKVENILKEIAGCEVSIGEMTAKNTFSMEFTGNYTTSGKNSARKKLDEIKPAHLIYWMTVFVHNDFMTKNQALLQNLRMSFSYTHFIEGYCLDGRHLLDGTWLLNAKRKGILFPKMMLQTSGARLDNDIKKNLVSYGLGHFYEENELQLKLLYSCVHTNFETGYRLDGRGLLNGTWLLRGARKGIAAYQLKTAFSMQNRNEQNADMQMDCYLKNSGSIAAALRYFTKYQYGRNDIYQRGFLLQADIQNTNKQSAEMKVLCCFDKNTSFVAAALKYFTKCWYGQNDIAPRGLSLQANIQNKNETKTLLTMDSMWQLDGSCCLEGTQRLNAQIKTEAV